MNKATKPLSVGSLTLGQRALKSLLLAALCAVLVACGGSQAPVQSSPQTQAEGAEPQQEAAESSPVTASAEVVDIAYQIFESFGRVAFYGIVENTDTVDINNVRIEITLLDSSGQQVANGESFPFYSLDVIPVGGKSPFVVNIEANGWQDYEVSVEAQVAAASDVYPDFEIVSAISTVSTNASGQTKYDVVGELRNTSAQDAGPFSIITAWYDEGGHIIGVGLENSAYRRVAPGGTTPFSLSFFPSAESEVAHDHELFIQSRAADPASPSLSAEVVDLNSYERHGDGEQTRYAAYIGMLENTGTVDMESVQVHITLRDSSGQVVATESASVVQLLPAGARHPFDLFFTGLTSDWQDFEIHVEAREAGQSSLVHYKDLEIISHVVSADSIWGDEVTGELRNNGTQDASARIILAAFDSSGRIIGVHSGFGRDAEGGGRSPFDIDAGSTVTFTAELSTSLPENTTRADHYELFVSAEVKK